MVNALYLVYCTNDEVLDGQRLPGMVDMPGIDTEANRNYKHWQGGPGYGSLIYLALRGWGRLRDWAEAVEAVRWAAGRGGEWPSSEDLTNAFALKAQLVEKIHQDPDGR